MSHPAAPRSRGLRLVLGTAAFVGVFALAAVAWIAAEAMTNPDVRARRPRWLDGAVGFDHTFWTPLLLTVVVGVALVLAVLLRAARRMASGEDLFANRYGRGVRRRGERFTGDDTDRAE